MLTSYVSHYFPVCYVMDGMVLLNKLNPKPTWVKKGADLAAASTCHLVITHITQQQLLQHLTAIGTFHSIMVR